MLRQQSDKQTGSKITHDDSRGIKVNAAADVIEPPQPPALRCPLTAEIFDVISTPWPQSAYFISEPDVCVPFVRDLSCLKAHQNKWATQLEAEIMKEFLPRVLVMAWSLRSTI